MLWVFPSNIIPRSTCMFRPVRPLILQTQSPGRVLGNVQAMALDYLIPVSSVALHT